MSAPASPGCAYDGRSTSGSIRRIKTSSICADLLVSRRPPYRGQPEPLGLHGRLSPMTSTGPDLSREPPGAAVVVAARGRLRGRRLVGVLRLDSCVGPRGWRRSSRRRSSAAGLAAYGSKLIVVDADQRCAWEQLTCPVEFVGDCRGRRRRRRSPAARGRGRCDGVRRLSGLHQRRGQGRGRRLRATVRRTGSSPPGIRQPWPSACGRARARLGARLHSGGAP